ncbi:MAG: hypothetical protein KC496_03615 [Anaerolineae bacterium]|nr:hypothetical protein [Anaerolineae bacterium]
MKHKYRVFQDTHSEGSYTNQQYFKRSMAAFRRKAPDPNDLSKWQYVTIIPMKSYRSSYCGNDGAQGYRHRETGYTIPDLCRQHGGQPEVWSQGRRRQLTIAPDSPILDGYILDYSQEEDDAAQ